VKPGELLFTAEQLAGRWEIGEDHGLVALAGAVERELATVTGRSEVRASRRGLSSCLSAAIFLSFHLFVCLSVYIYVSINLYLHLHLHLSIHPSIGLGLTRTSFGCREKQVTHTHDVNHLHRSILVYKNLFLSSLLLVSRETGPTQARQTKTDTQRRPHAHKHTTTERAMAQRPLNSRSRLNGRSPSRAWTLLSFLANSLLPVTPFYSCPYVSILVHSCGLGGSFSSLNTQPHSPYVYILVYRYLFSSIRLPANGHSQ